MEQMQFKVSSALKDLVGKDLIINDNIAIFELVKNSYDAYATKVEIKFSDNEIVIADNGKGMSFDDLKNKWLFLGYSAKKDGTEDAGNDVKQKSYRDKIKTSLCRLKRNWAFLLRPFRKAPFLNDKKRKFTYNRNDHC